MKGSLLAPMTYSVVYSVSLLPYCVLRGIGQLAYLLGWKLFGYRKSVILQNLSRSFPDKKYKEIDDLATKNAKWLFHLFPEWAKNMSDSRSRMTNRVSFENLESLDQEGNVFITLGHYGNWECLNVLPAFVNRPVYAVYKQQSSKVADHISMKMRTRLGVQLLESKESARFVLKNKEPAIFIFISDQAHASNKPGFMFMHQPTNAFEGVERLASATHGNVVYAEINPLGNRNYKVVFMPFDSVIDATRVFFRHLEETINKKPEYWLWSHRRWKHKVVLEN